MARWRGRRVWWAVAGVLVVALAVALVVTWPLVRRYTGAAPPAQFYEKVQLEPALAQDYGQVLGVAHNAGPTPGTLATALRDGAGVTKLDLMQTDHKFLDELVAFLTARPRSRRVMISSRDPAALLYLHRRLPGATLLFSVPFPDAVHQLQSDHALQQAIGGASVFQGLVDANLVSWMHEHKLIIVAWTVNESERFNQLVRLGVDGITTANLAILRALR